MIRLCNFCCCCVFFSIVCACVDRGILVIYVTSTWHAFALVRYPTEKKTLKLWRQIEKWNAWFWYFLFYFLTSLGVMLSFLIELNWNFFPFRRRDDFVWNVVGGVESCLLPFFEREIQICYLKLEWIWLQDV